MTEIGMVDATCRECGFPLSAMDETRLIEGIRAHYAFVHPKTPRHVDLPAIDQVCKSEGTE